MKNITVQINPQIVLYALVGIGLAWLVLELRQVFVILFVAFILSCAMGPLVDRLQSRGVPRFVGILSLYVLILVVVGVIVSVVANELVTQMQNLFLSFPAIYARFVEFINSTSFLGQALSLQNLQLDVNDLFVQLAQGNFIRDFVSNQGASTVRGAVSVLGGLASLLLTLFTTVMVSVYLMESPNKVRNFVSSLAPQRHQQRVLKLVDQVQDSLGGWVVGQILLMLAIGIMVYVALLLPAPFIPGYELHKFALPIALLAGLLEALPSIGPLITLVVAGIVGIGTGGVGVLIYVIVTFVLIQNLEAVFLVPQVMNKAVGLDPIITILGIIGAFSIGGIVAAILAVPVIAMLQIGFNEYIEIFRERDRRQTELA